MILHQDKTTNKNTAMMLLIGLVLSTTFSGTQATNVTNGIEMGLAAAVVPFDIAARCYDFTESKKTAAFLHLTTDTISLLNKAFFFYNNYQAQYRTASPRDKRDCWVNGVWLTRDVTRLFQHLKAYKTAKNVVPVPGKAAPVAASKVLANNDDLFLVFGETFEPELQPEEISRLMYTWHVVVLPILRGLTACALAYSQDEASGDLDSEQGRFLATAAHSLVRLSEEYTELEPGNYKKILAVALVANGVWLCKELQDFTTYKKNQEERLNIMAAMAARERQREEARVARAQGQLNQLLANPQAAVVQNIGQCRTCLDDDANLIQLPCGHGVACRGCLRDHIEAGLGNVAELYCPNHNNGCNHRITDADVRVVVGDDRDFLQRFILAGIPQAGRDERMCGRCLIPHQPDVDCANGRIHATDEDRQIADDFMRLNLRYCPGENCGRLIHKDGGCNYINCDCNHEFCWRCLQPAPGHAMYGRNGRFENPCGCPVSDA